METLDDADAIVLVTKWPEYRELPWLEIYQKVRVPIILDGRNFLPRNELEKLGFKYIGVGR